MNTLSLHISIPNVTIGKNMAGNNNERIHSKISCKSINVETYCNKKKDNNLYEVLSLGSKNVGFEEIKTAYRRMALLYHPDVACPNNPSAKEESTKRFIELREAYETLSNPRSREMYDYELGLVDQGLGFGVEGTRSCLFSKELWENQLHGLKRRSQIRMKKRKYQ